ncbi:hypothetical protein, partial [Roseospira navarrensis]
MNNIRKKSWYIYWQVYGGLNSLFSSPFFWGAVIVALVSGDHWAVYDNGQPLWVPVALNAIPSILGFSMGGMAILLAFSGKTFVRIVTKNGEGLSLCFRRDQHIVGDWAFGGGDAQE